MYRYGHNYEFATTEAAKQSQAYLFAIRVSEPHDREERRVMHTTITGVECRGGSTGSGLCDGSQTGLVELGWSVHFDASTTSFGWFS